MFESYFFKGFLMGIVFGVPAGAIGVLTIRNSLENGFFAGLLTGLGSSVADLFYAIVTVFGVTIISDIMLKHQTVLGLFGGLMIIVLGILNFAKKRYGPSFSGHQIKIMGQFTTSFTIAILNPATIFSFFIAFSAFGISGEMSLERGVRLIFGILSGTCFWWIGLSGSVSVFRKRVTEKNYHCLNRILGGLLVILGLAVLVKTLSGSGIEF